MRRFAKDLVAVVIDLVVAGEDALRQLDIAAHHGVEGHANHFFGEFAHARQIDVGLDARVAQDAQRALRDVDALIADAFEIVVNAGNGQDEAQVRGHELVQGEKLHDAIVNFQLQFVDGAFFVEDALGEGFVGIQHAVHGLMHGALGEAAHPEEGALSHR